MSEKGLRGNWKLRDKLLELQVRGVFIPVDLIDQILSAVVEELPKEKKAQVKHYTCTQQSMGCPQNEVVNLTEKDLGWNTYRQAAIAAIKGGE